MTRTGLRERNKAKRHAAILTAALELFAERGYDGTTIADIAAAAEVAPRTISLYFPSKQDIVLAEVADAAERLTAALRQRRPGESPVEVFGAWLRAERTRHDARTLDLVHRMHARNPEMRALSAARMEPALAEIARALAADLGVGADDPRPHIVTAAMVGVFEYVWTASITRDIDETVDLAVGFLTAGLAGLGRA
jgi:AcrR family transcriptional regulator